MILPAWVAHAISLVLTLSITFTSWVKAHEEQQRLRPSDHHIGSVYYSHPGSARLVNSYTVNHAGRWTVRIPQKLDKNHQSKKLVPFVFEPLPLGSVKPLGWMKDQMQLMADGLPGHMHTFYRLIKNATWVGGEEEYSMLNEAWPYWYNGIVALAYGLDDERLKHEVDRVTNEVLDHQFKDGWLGPEHLPHRRNFWGRYPFLLGLMQLVEVAGKKRSERLLNSIHNFTLLTHRMVTQNNQGYVNDGKLDDFDEQWGRSRAADMVLFLEWLYEKHPRNNSAAIFQTMVHFYEYSFDWSYWFQEDVFGKGNFDKIKGGDGDVRDSIFPYIHAVNAGQGLKYGAVMRRLTHIDRYVEDTLRGTNYTFQYHGTPSGGIVGDEGESGISPHRGTELCSVVETIYSLTYNYQSLGDRYYADRAELAAYNALPVMITSDWWAHQYIAQSNQPVSHNINDPPFWNVGSFGTTFGTEPNYPCCAVNFAQGLPKYLSASFVRNGREGLAHAFLMPAEVKTTLESNATVHIRCETNYPFENDLKYSIHSDSAFTFSVRIPSWAESYIVKINDQEQIVDQNDHESSSGLLTLPLSKGAANLEITFSTSPRVEFRNHETVSIHYGTLLYALPVPAEWQGRRPENYRHENSAPGSAKDWSATPHDDFKWNIAIDPSTIKVVQPPPNERGQPLPNPIWTINAPSTRISVMACEIEDWKLTEKQGGYAPPPPLVGHRKCKGSPFRVQLQPYGALKLHMAEFPRFESKTTAD